MSGLKVKKLGVSGSALTIDYVAALAVFCLPMPLARWASAPRIAQVPGVFAPLPTLQDGVEFAELLKPRALHCVFTSETLFVRLLWRTHPSRRCLPSSLHSPVCAPLLPIPLPFTPPPQRPPGHSRLWAALPRTLCLIGPFVDDQGVRSQFIPSVPRDTAICIAIAAAAVSTIVRRETAWGRRLR